MVDAATIVGFFANGIVFGSILALAAAGLSLVYGILNLGNFAHGDFLAFGALATYGFAVEWSERLLPLGLILPGLLLAFLAVDAYWLRRLHRAERVVTAAVAGLVAAFTLWSYATSDPQTYTSNAVLAAATGLAVLATVGMVLGIEFLVWRPLRRRGGTTLTLILVSIGVALVVRNLLLLYFGGDILAFVRPTPISDEFLGAKVSKAQQFTIAASLLLMGGLHLFLSRTRTGKAMRALADNRDLARISGVDVDRVIVHVWALAGGLTALAGMLLSLVQNNTMNANMGFHLLIPLFAAVILGGIGNPYGAVLGGLIVGVAMRTSALWIGNEYELASAYLILIVVLILRPQGLFGGKIR